MSSVWQARLLGSLVAAAGVVGLASELAPARGRLRVVEGAISPEARHLASGATALIGLMLILVG